MDEVLFRHFNLCYFGSMLKSFSKYSDDLSLFNDFRSGNNRNFDYFFDKYYQGLCVYANRMVDSRSASEDIVQDFFIKLWENRPRLEIKTDIKSYFLRSIHNRCLDYLARQRVRQDHKTNQLKSISEEELWEYPLLDFELEQRLQKAINELPDGIRETFIMNRFEGLSYQEIAEKENVSVKAIEYRISKALSILRLDLQEYLVLVILFSKFH